MADRPRRLSPIRATDEEHELIQRAADRAGISVSTYIRAAALRAAAAARSTGSSLAPPTPWDPQGGADGDVHVLLRFDSDTYATLAAIAREGELSVSDYLRMAVVRYTEIILERAQDGATADRLIRESAAAGPAV